MDVVLKEKTNKAYEISKMILFPFLAFSITFVLALLVHVTNNFYPFDKIGHTFLMVDAQSEYIAYLRYLRHIYSEGETLSYTMGKVFGGDFLSIYTFYLASPFNYFLPLISEQDIPVFIFYTCLLKMAFGSLNMYLLFMIKEKKATFGQLAFAISYGLMNYSFMYMSNYMWLDGVMILPLVILGLNLLYKENKALWLYPISLAYALATSWYIGAMICVFVVFYFFKLLIGTKEDKKIKLFKVIRFTIFSLIGGFFASFLWIPAFSHFDGTKVHSLFSDPQMQLPTLFFEGLMSNSYGTSRTFTKVEGYANMFTSLPCYILMTFYFVNKKIDRRERFSYFILLLIYFFGICHTTLNDLLHFGSKPTWFPARYSFIIGFISLELAENERIEYEKTTIVSWILGFSIFTSMMLLIKFMPSDNTRPYEYTKVDFIIGSLTMVIMLMTFILHYFFSKKNNVNVTKILTGVFTLSIIPLSIYSSFDADKKLVSNNVFNHEYQNIETYLKDVSYQKDVDILKEYDNNKNYRMEMTTLRPGSYNSIDNNPLFYNYYGLSHFSSSEKKVVEEYYHKLGYHYNGFFEKWDKASTTSMNSFLGLKYVMEEKYKNYIPSIHNSPYVELDSLETERFTYYENVSALPLGFRVEKQNTHYISEGHKIVDATYWYDHFEYQNKMYHNMNNSLNKDIFTKVETTVVLSSGVEVNKEYPELNETYYSLSKGDSIIYKFNILDDDANKNLYFGLKNDIKNLSLYFDGIYYKENDYWHNGIWSLKNKVGAHTIKLVATKDISNTLIRPEIYLEDESVLKEYTDKIKEQGSNNLKQIIGKFSFGYEGDFVLTSDNSDFIFTLPYEKNMHVYIDDKEVPCSTKFNIFTGVSLDTLSKGSHKIKILYIDKYQRSGIVISGIALCALIGVEFCYFYLDKNKLLKETNKKF